MPRSLWSGAISFGLVSIPVQLFSATQSKDVRFHFVDRRDQSPIGYDKVNKKTGEPVPDEHIARGFEFEKGRFVELEDEDIDRLDVELTHAVDICDFVALEDIDPIYFRQAYYLLPQDGAEKPYRLLQRALDETGQVAIAKIVIRNKQHLACVRPGEGVLVLETMYFADEIRKPEDVPAPRLQKAEVDMAKSLIENLATEWKPERYHDRYRSQLLDLLQKKAEGEPLPEPTETEGGEVVDLMEALRQSVAQTRKQGKRKPASGKAASHKTSSRKPARKAS